MLGKWNCRFIKEREALQKRIILGKFKGEGGWSSCNVRDSYEVGLWKAIKQDGMLLKANIVSQ